MSLSFNEFQRELQRRNIPDNVAYMLTLIYERLVQLAQEGNQQSKIVLSLATSLQAVVDITEADRKNIKALARGGIPDGVDVHSVAIDPDEHKKKN